MASLAIACKEGFESIALKLLSAGAYTNVQDRAGDTNLILACKGGHKVGKTRVRFQNTCKNASMRLERHVTYYRVFDVFRA